MLRLTATSAIAVLFVFVSLTARAAERVKTEVDGTWEVVVDSGKAKVDPNAAKSRLVVVQDNGIETMMKDGRLYRKSFYTVNAKANPKQITWSDPKQGGKVSQVGIYKIDGDTMTFAVLADKTKRTTERPKDFEPSESTMVGVCKRVKSEIDGTWEVTRFNELGKDAAQDAKSKFLVVRENGEQSMTKGGKPCGKTICYSIDPTAKPKRFTFSDPNQPDKIAYVGIYELNGDAMKVAMFAKKAKRATEWPKDFEPSKEKHVAEYKRVKGK
jgi:uncharacterized protein (TIGR03067 family)